jgi:hypothetical protein
MTKIELYFACLARDCADNLKENLSNIIDICTHEAVNNYEIWIAENDSVDSTRKVLQKYECKNPAINLCLFKNLDNKYSVRVSRIAFLRQSLLENIRESVSNTYFYRTTPLYIPIDLDSKIAQSIETAQFIDECLRVASGEVDAVFPSSEPYYYDIYALRADGWVESDCWDAVKKYKKYIGSFIPKYTFVYKNQKSIKDIRSKGRIPVYSAFGGVGIYDLSSLSGANYKNGNRYPQSICEHVVFNHSCINKEISTEFVIHAPEEHINYKSSSLFGKMQFIIESMYSDVEAIIKKLLKIGYD